VAVWTDISEIITEGSGETTLNINSRCNSMIETTQSLDYVRSSTEFQIIKTGVYQWTTCNQTYTLPVTRCFCFDIRKWIDLEHTQSVEVLLGYWNGLNIQMFGKLVD
jgi:hypothetical protein